MTVTIPVGQSVLVCQANVTALHVALESSRAAPLRYGRTTGQPAPPAAGRAVTSGSEPVLLNAVSSGILCHTTCVAQRDRPGPPGGAVSPAGASEKGRPRRKNTGQQLLLSPLGAGPRPGEWGLVLTVDVTDAYERKSSLAHQENGPTKELGSERTHRLVPVLQNRPGIPSPSCSQENYYSLGINSEHSKQPSNQVSKLSLKQCDSDRPRLGQGCGRPVTVTRLGGPDLSFRPPCTPLAPFPRGRHRSPAVRRRRRASAGLRRPIGQPKPPPALPTCAEGEAFPTRAAGV